MSLDYSCDLCGAPYAGIRAALRCCEERLEAQAAGEPVAIADGVGPYPRVHASRDQEKLSALIEGGWYNVLATVNREVVSSDDVRLALQEVERELEHLVALETGADHEPAQRVRADGGENHEL